MLWSTVSVGVSAGPAGFSVLGSAAVVAVAVGLVGVSAIESEGVVGDEDLHADIASSNQIQQSAFMNLMREFKPRFALPAEGVTA